MTRVRFTIAIAVLVSSIALAGVLHAASAPKFSAYSSYGAKFDLGSQTFSLITSMVVYNISGKVFSDVVFKQTYPEGVSVKETYQREVGTEETGEQSSDRKVEGNVFFAELPSYKNGQYVVIFNELELARRLNEITFPGVELSYTDDQGERQVERLDDNTLDLFIYSNVVGGLKRFLGKYNKITFDFKKAVPDRTGWEFAPIAASARGRFPTGIVGTYPGENQYSGHFRVRSGPPGDNIQILVIYEESDDDSKVSSEEQFRSKVQEYLRWCGEFEVMEENLQITQDKWKKYKETWSLEGRWRDTIKARLGEGILRAKVFFGPREDVQYYVLALGHGRGLGAEESATPNPEKEAQLAAQIDALLDTFKSTIVPLSYERR
jgi:hypothetical protein